MWDLVDWEAFFGMTLIASIIYLGWHAFVSNLYSQCNSACTLATIPESFGLKSPRKQRSRHRSDNLSEEELLNRYEKTAQQANCYVLRYNEWHVHWLVIPSLGLSSCVFLSLWYNFESVTTTTCSGTPFRPKNFLPSISAAIGDHAPQRYIWRLCVSATTCQRMLDGFALTGYLEHRLKLLYQNGPQTSFLLWSKKISWVIEHISLALLTDVSSSDNLLLHEIGFAVFLAASISHMVIDATLFRRLLIENLERDRITWRWRIRAIIANALCAAGAMVFFFWHELYCSNYVYSVFSMCEWAFVFTNILYHCVEGVDIAGMEMRFVLPTPQRKAT